MYLLDWLVLSAVAQEHWWGLQTIKSTLHILDMHTTGIFEFFHWKTFSKDELHACGNFHKDQKNPPQAAMTTRIGNWMTNLLLSISEQQHCNYIKVHVTSHFVWSNPIHNSSFPGEIQRGEFRCQQRGSWSDNMARQVISLINNGSQTVHSNSRIIENNPSIFEGFI